MAGPTCPDAALASGVQGALRRNGGATVSLARVASALARVRAARALGQARALYTRTHFAGCIALLSITEQELGRHLVSPDAALQQRGHQLLAEVNLWLGICQWAAGDPQTAASSFIRAGQLPGTHAPDPRLLPPELVQAHREAMGAPRQSVSCQLDARLRPEHLLLDGREVRAEAGSFEVTAGTHYLSLRVRCAGGDTACQELQRSVGPDGMRSLRLEASSLSCRVRVPSVSSAHGVTCASLSETEDAALVGQLVEESGAAGALAISLDRGRLALRLRRGTSAGFTHRLETQLEGEADAAKIAARSIDLILGGGTGGPLSPGGKRWYEHWWVWASISAAVVVATTAAVVATRPEHVQQYRVVFGP